MNEEKLIDVLAAIERGEPGLRHSQANWFSRPAKSGCGTTACLAGWTAHLAGYQPVWERMAPFDDMEAACAVYKGESGRRYPVAIIARRVLELSSEEGHTLFHVARSLPSVYRNAAEIMGVDEQVLRDKVRARVA